MARRIAPSSDEEEESDELRSSDGEGEGDETFFATGGKHVLQRPDTLASESAEELDELDELLSSSEPDDAAREDAGGSDFDQASDDEEAAVPSNSNFKIKLKMSANAASQDASGSRSGRNQKKPAPASVAALRGSRKRKRKDDDDLSEEEDVSDSEASESSSLNLSRLTARQRAKELGTEADDSFMSLPLYVGKKKKVLTEAEQALKKSEDSRKRRAQADKKLEDEKQETINRLLKKTTKPKGSATPADGTATPSVTASQPKPPVLPTMIRYVSSIKSGDYVATCSLPLGVPHILAQSTSSVVYPGPRPPPNSRKL